MLFTNRRDGDGRDVRLPGILIKVHINSESFICPRVRSTHHQVRRESLSGTARSNAAKGRSPLSRRAAGPREGSVPL